LHSAFCRINVDLTVDQCGRLDCFLHPTAAASLNDFETAPVSLISVSIGASLENRSQQPSSGLDNASLIIAGLSSFSTTAQ
jgi:hypothetical protein